MSHEDSGLVVPLDFFGCLPSKKEKNDQKIRNDFVELYQRDMIQRVRFNAMCIPFSLNCKFSND